ncbi:MAG: fasciclin domain-containing protein [Myxococcales bacterium]|nr:MAG: fasciclin domain-containing protein [Myxococcales bacterium]
MRTTSLFSISLLALALSGCAKDAPQASTAASAPAEPNIVAVAAGAGQFNTLVAAVKAADLVETLQSPGPFTVFAPTDEAFAKLPAGTVDSLLLPENKSQLTAILKYHVVAGEVRAADVVKLTSDNTVEVQPDSITASGSVVRVNAAHVIKDDVMASNGVIHVIDTVLIPSS